MPADAYFITFGTYGSWLPGDDRGSTTRAGGIRGPNAPLRCHAASVLKSAPVTLGPEDRAIVLAAMVEVTRYRGWRLVSAHVRTQHVHCVVCGAHSPERMMNDLKAYSTRALRRGTKASSPVWAQHGSTRWLWSEDQIAAAARYVHEGQGEPMARYP